MKISKRFLSYIIVLLSLVSTINLYAQSVAVNTFVPTSPPPITFQEILSFESDVVFQLTNLTSDRLEVKFGMTLTNARRGIYVAIVEDYLPSTPINLEAGESKNLRFRNIKAAYDNLTEDDIILEGLDYESIIRAERLPEGDYELCITVQDYYTNELLSAEGSCGYFPVLEYEPPIIIYPIHEQIVVPIDPQNIMFQWTPTGDITKTKYRLQLVNASDYGFVNPIDVYNHEEIAIAYDEIRITYTNRVYNQNHPILVEGDTYVVRVQAYDENNELNYLNDGWSAPVTFEYRDLSDGPDSYVNDNGTTTNLATVECTNYMSDISEVLNPNIQVGQMLQVNDFEMETSQLQFNSVSESYSGEGLIFVPFLNTTVEVAFSNIKINTDNRVYGDESLIYGQVDNSNIVSTSTAQDWDSPADLNFTPNYESIIQSKQSGSQTDLPFRFAGSEAVISGFLLMSNQAKFKVNLPIALPEISGGFDPYISFVNNNICVDSDGFQQSAISLLLPEDVNVPLISNKMKLKLPADENEASIDANGQYQLDIDGEIVFDKSIVAYKNNNNKVKIPFSKQNASGLDQLIVVTENVNKLIYPGLKDLQIIPEQIVIDLSSNSNAQGFNSTFSGYTSLWKGVFVKAGDVKLPKGLGGSNLKVEIDGLALSANGLSLKVDNNQNVVNLSDGRVASWPFSINGFELTIEEGELTDGQMNGNLRLPIQSGGKIGYSGLLSSGNENTLKVDMNVQPSDDIKVDMWLATINIDEASTIGLHKINGKYKIEADINGSLSINHNNTIENISLSQINIPSLDFQHLVVTGQQGSNPTMDVGAVALEEASSQQLSVQAFDFTLEDWGIRKEGGRHALNFSVGISLFGGDLFDGVFGAGVATELDIWAKYQNGFKLDEVNLSEIEAELDLGIADAYVKINLYDSDPTYGNGFRGEAGIKLARIATAVEIGAVIQFGKVDGYRYWYFDGYFKSNSGIALANSGASLFGFGGGGYYNMSAVGPDENEVQRYNELADANPVSYTNPTQSISDFTYEPLKDGRGFRAMAIIGCAATSRAWNVECNLLIDWKKGSGIKSVVFEGKFNMMRGIDDDGDPPIKLFDNLESTMLINVQRDNDNTRTFQANLDTKLNGHFGSAYFPISFLYSSKPNGDNKKWYIRFGSWSKADPFDDDSRITMTKGPNYDFFTFEIIFKAYLMMGNTYKSGSIIPPLPDDIINATSDQYGNGPQQRDAGAAANIENKLKGEDADNFGIGMGLGMKLDVNIEVLMFYTRFSAEVVADFALTLPQQGCFGVNSLGFNGWFASGQAYALVEGAVGVKGRLFGKDIDVHLINLTAGAAFSVQFPYPKRIYGKVFIGGSIFNGRIKIKPRGIEYNKGQKCIPIGEFNPLENIKYVNEVIPNNKTNVNVFANPKIAFNLSNKEILTFQDIEEKTHTYRVDYTIRLKNLKTNTLVDIKEYWSFNDQAYRMVPENWLEAKTEYEIIIYIKAYEKKGASFKEFETKTKKYTFETGKRPDYIPANDIVQSYPGLSQRYFMIEKDNGSEITGFLNLNQVVCGDILKEVNFNDPQDGYYAVFTNLRTRQKKFVDCYCADDKRIEWQMPQNIAPEDIFRIELLARDFEGVLASPEAELEEAWVGTSHLQANGVPTTTLYEQQTYEYVNKDTYTSHTKTKNLLDDKIGWYAQRSKFRSYGEKLDKFTLHQIAYLPYNIGYQNPITEGIVPDQVTTNQISKAFHIPFLLLRPNAMIEPFDQYDLVGYASPIFGIGRIDPILNPTARFGDYCGEYAELRSEQLGEDEDPNREMEFLTKNSSVWPRPTRYPYYSGPDETMGLLPRWLKNYKRYERKLADAGYNVNLWRPAPRIQPEEVNSLIQGHSADASGLGLNGNINPTHGSGGATELQIYQYIDPVTTNSFTTVEEDGPDVQGPTGLFTNNSYLPLVDWSSLIMYKDRVHKNKFAISRYNSISHVIDNIVIDFLNLNGYFEALEELDNRFRNLQIPSAEYKIKVKYQTGGNYDIHYQYNRP